MKGALLLLLVTVFLNIAGFSLILPLLPFYAKEFGVNPFAVACLFAAYSLGNLFGEMFWGRRSDAIGRRPVLILTTALAAVSYVAFAFSPSYSIALIIRIACGFFSGTFGVVQGAIADITLPQDRAKNMGFFGAAFNLGFAAGPGIGGLLANTSNGLSGFHLPILGSAAFAAAASIWAMLALPETRPADAKVRKVPSYREGFEFVRSSGILWRLFLIAFCGIAAFSSMEAVFGLWTGHNFGWTAHEVGMTFLAIGGAGLTVQLFMIAPLVSRLGEAGVIMLGIGVLIVAILAIPLARLPIATVALMALLMAGHSLAFPNAGALVSLNTPPDRQGSVMGLNMASNALSRIVGPPLFGWVYGMSADLPYYACGAMLAAMLPASWGVWRITGRR